MRTLGVVLSMIGSLAVAGPHEGMFRPEAKGATMSWDRTVGADGGALAGFEDTYHWAEDTCRLAKPVPVRGTTMTPCDENCTGEGMTESRQMMIMTTSGGTAVVNDRFVNTPVRGS